MTERASHSRREETSQWWRCVASQWSQSSVMNRQTSMTLPAPISHINILHQLHYVNSDRQTANYCSSQLTTEWQTVPDVSSGWTEGAVGKHVFANREHVFANRAFSSTAAHIWNSLPLTLRTRTSVTTFRRHLKTYLFSNNTASK